MKPTYSRIRIALMTFTLGLAAFWMADALSIAWRDVPVDLPIAESSDVRRFFLLTKLPGSAVLGQTRNEIMGNAVCTRSHRTQSAAFA